MFKTDNLDLTYLLKEKYDKNMDKLLGQDTPVANLADVKQGKKKTSESLFASTVECQNPNAFGFRTLDFCPSSRHCPARPKSKPLDALA